MAVIDIKCVCVDTGDFCVTDSFLSFLQALPVPVSKMQVLKRSSASAVAVLAIAVTVAVCLRYVFNAL